MKRIRYYLIGFLFIATSMIICSQTPASEGYSSVLYESNYTEGEGALVDWDFYGDNIVTIKVTSKVIGMSAVYITNVNDDNQKVTL